MFRTKKDVDRHVQDIFRKLKNENEKNLRCYNIAKLYYQVGDYESAKRYVSTYLEVRPDSAGAHKLLGQAFEALGQKEAALAQYKTSLELEGRQEDLVLKVCELLAGTDIGIDVNRIKYWIERADKQFPHHPVVFQLKEKMLTVEKPNDNEDLEALIASELSVRPSDVNLRVKLLKYYITRHKFDDAYKHATDVEATHSHRNSIIWYQSLTELLLKCKENKHTDWSFWIFYISALERYAALCLKEQGNETIKTIPEATLAVINFDQQLAEFKSKTFSNKPSFTENMLTHMCGQLHFHLACLLLRKAKREQGSWSEAGRLCAPLLLAALHTHPVDPTASWAMHLEDHFENQVYLWFREGSYRCSQAGHVLQDYAKDDTNKLMDRISKFCAGQWRKRIYQEICVSKIHQQIVIESSYFANYTGPTPPMRLCSYTELRQYDEVSESVYPDSLHHQVWLGIKTKPQSKDSGPHPHQYSHVFPELQFSVYNINQAAADSLCRLDIDAFLNAAIYCSSTIMEEQLLYYLSPDRLPTLPADLTSTLCTSAQEKWWSLAYKMYSKQEAIEEHMGEIRQQLQQGLEVIRCIGNHGLHPALLVHLARIFSHRAKLFKEKDKQHPDILALEARSELYWSTVIPLLERLQNNQPVRITTSKLFNYQGKELNNTELTNALEEGRLLLVQRFIRDKQYEQAIEALQALKCPEASFQQGQIYKILADELVSSMPRESLTSEMRSQHIIMLSKARNCFYLTLDRLRSPGIDPKHPLNSELGTYIADMENELKRIDPDLWRGDLSKNDCDGMSEDTYSSAHSVVDQPIANQAPTLGILGNSVNMINTPQRNSHRTQKQTSTPCRPQHQDLLDLSRNRTEARPSPERLDAQIRQMIQSRDNIVQTVLEQNKAVLETNKTIMDKIEELTREIADLRKDVQRQRAETVNQPNMEEDLYGLGEEEYGDLNYTANQTEPTSSMSGNMFPPTHRHYSPLVYPSATAFQGYYHSGIIQINDPNAQPIPPLYTPNVYPMPVIYPNRSKVPDNALQQSLFTQRIPTQLGDLMPQANQPLQMPLQKMDAPKPESAIKDAPVNKAPPVNVVITTSDTVPTTAPLVQPTLSVTIPPHYRLGTSSVQVTTEQNNVPHCYQISMPSQATIPTTVNLPPLSTTLTTTPASISISQASKDINTNACTVESPNTSTELCETEHDPIPDFVPVIPLPDEVKVTTGEENEVTLYCARAKLFRFVDKEWKERGVGNVKLLQNAEGKIRLLMRRDQVLKICANHMLRSDMELTAMPNNDRAWIWVANDFADEEVKLEKLCIKFKTVEEASSFKEHFDKARKSLSQLPEQGIKDNKGASSVNEPDSTKTMSSTSKNAFITKTIAQKSQSESETTSTPVGGFSFSSKSVVQKVPAEDVKVSQKQEESAKPNPFSGFVFSKTPVTKSETTSVNTILKATAVSNSTVSTQPSGFSFAKTPDTSITSFETASNESTPNIFSQSSLRRPHMPPPAAKEVGTRRSESQATEIETAPFELETTVFEQKGSLQILKDKLWMEKSSAALIKLLLGTKSEKVRLLVQDERFAKTCYDHFISPSIKFAYKEGSFASIVWDHTKEKGKTETYSLTFKTLEHASQFYKAVLNYQKAPKDRDLTENNKKQENKKDKAQKSLAEMFKPAAGTWECNACYVRNNASASECISCGSSNPFAVPARTEATSTNPTPLPRIKLPAGSWKCSTCLICNTASNDYCVACETPKDPSMPPKPKESTFNLGVSNTESTPTFSFGIPQDTAKEFTFRLSKTESSESPKSTTPLIFGNANKPEDSSVTFTFGISQGSSTPGNKVSSSPFTFGAPGKSFGFQFPNKSPAKSPSGAENSEEEVDEDEDIHFTPIVPLPDKIEVKTGEEDEEVLYSHRAKLFRFDSSVREWKERGLGDIKLLKHKETGKLRLIMRRDQILKLCLNHFLLPDLEFSQKDEKTWFWSAADYSEGEIECMKFACRFKTPEIAADFKKAIDDARNSSVQTQDAETRTKTVAKETTNITPSQDVQVLYEVKVTPEEKAAAQKLLLPENFYAYKQKADCPGCIGCKEPEVPLFEAKSSTSSNIQSTTETTNTTTDASSTVKTGFSFGKPPKSNQFELPTTNVFANGSHSSKDGDPSFSDKKTGFVFGTPATEIVQTNKVENQTNLLVENLKICSPASGDQQTPKSSSANTSSSPFGIFGSAPGSQQTATSGKSIFGGTASASHSLIKPPSFSFSGGNTPSVFGNSFNSLAKTTSSTTPISSVKTTTPFESFANATTTASVAQVSSSQSVGFPALTTITTEAFKAAPVFSKPPSLFSSAPNSNSSSFANSSANASNLFISKPAESTSQKEDIECFLPAANITFSTLAAVAEKSAPVPFKADPDFSFAGAGSFVFGSAASSAADAKSRGNKKTLETSKSSAADGGAEDDNDNEEGDNEQEHDPHFEPIVPLPDTIEIRTGEEEEEKIFCQRAKLYRYDNNTREWKERGVGEMKILHHAGHGSYRLLLRREQVHKVVCNFLLKPDIEFRMLSSSDRAWIWAGMNHAEETPTVEELAVKFKNPELATQFKETVDKVQQILREKQHSSGKKSTADVQEDEDEEEDEDDLDEEEEEDEDDLDETTPMFEKRATLHTRGIKQLNWHLVALGNLIVCYDSNIFGARIILKADESGKVVSNTIISIESEMQVEEKECTWVAIDYALEPPVSRHLKAVFSSTQAAEQMFKTFQEGLHYAKEAGISESTYHE